MVNASDFIGIQTCYYFVVAYDCLSLDPSFVEHVTVFDGGVEAAHDFRSQSGKPAI
jgi:hypothetical protein